MCYLCIMSIVRNTESDLEFENKIRPQELELSFIAFFNLLIAGRMRS